MVVYGETSTLPIKMDTMIETAKRCAGAPTAFVIGDMPFPSYQVSVPDAVITPGVLRKKPAVMQ